MFTGSVAAKKGYIIETAINGPAPEIIPASPPTNSPINAHVVNSNIFQFHLSYYMFYTYQITDHS